MHTKGHNKDWQFTQDAFEKLLLFLDEDRENAGMKYEAIWASLVKMFEARGSNMPEELADETISRVASKVAEISESYTGEATFYFYGVARNVFRESLRKRTTLALEYAKEVVDRSAEDEKRRERQMHCLEECLSKLPDDQRSLITEYYTESIPEKIKRRKGLAKNLGIPLNTLRLRIHRIRRQLEDCVRSCTQDE